MVDIVRVVEQIVVSQLLASRTPFIGRTMGERVLMGLFVVFLALGLMFLVFALYLWVKSVQTPEVAAAVTGAGALVLALILGGIQLFVLWWKARKIRKVKQDVEAILREVLSAAGDEVSANVRDNPKASAALSVVLGLLVGDRAF